MQKPTSKIDHTKANYPLEKSVHWLVRQHWRCIFKGEFYFVPVLCQSEIDLDKPRIPPYGVHEVGLTKDTVIELAYFLLRSFTGDCENTA